MKYVYLIFAGIVILFISYVHTYNKGYDAGQKDAYIEYQGEINAQIKAVQEANKKIVDFQKKIANNNDECFNQLWSSDVIESVNPQLKGF